MEVWAPGCETRLDLPAGGELLVLEGTCTESATSLRPMSWLRVPAGGSVDAVAGAQGTRVWVKAGGTRPERPHG